MTRMDGDRDRDGRGRPANARPRDRFGAPLPRGARDQMADRVEPEEVADGLDDAVRRGAALFDAQRFFEAHEFFEWVWKSAEIDEAERPFWKGVAQIAVGYCHTQRGNATGAVTLLTRGADYTEGFPAGHRGIDVRRLRADARAFAASIRVRGVGPDRAFPAFPRA